MSLAVYLPQDRSLALATHQQIAEQSVGTALFADISGFTPLTKALDLAFGSRRAADLMTQQLNFVYEALIACIDQYAGSVINFAGDAITCWFSAESAALHACAAALAMQQAMQAFQVIQLPDQSRIALGLKIAIASGLAHRFVVGDPSIQRIDALGGVPLAQVALGEHLANQGEILIDRHTYGLIKPTAIIGEWRSETFALLQQLTIDSLPSQPHLPINLPDELLQQWVLPAIYQRFQAGLGSFLTELRPAIALFLRFEGIDYDHDPAAGQQLDRFITRVQQIVARYAGHLLQLTIGDKGSYIYAAFGAPTAHEDDPIRAAYTALEWLHLPDELPFLKPLQIGVASGVMRAGAYGGPTRRTYGIIGDDVNLAARLMQNAAPGSILISEQLHTALAYEFLSEQLPAIQLKGMPAPLPVYQLIAWHERNSSLPEPAYRLPMIGRTSEAQFVETRLEQVLQRQGQVVAITAEAGMGKSRFVAEIIHLANQRGMDLDIGACQSYGTNIPYLVWGPIWRGFFRLEPSWPLAQQLQQLHETIQRLAPRRMEALPLLGPLLGLSIAENDFCRALEPQFRQSVLHALLLDCLLQASKTLPDTTGYLLVLEDLHWIDAASYALLEQIVRAITHAPILILLAYRPLEIHQQFETIAQLPLFSHIQLAPFSTGESLQLIQSKLNQFMSLHVGSVPTALVERITTRAEGNPFYIEELLNYLKDYAVDLYDLQAIEQLELPESLHTLILSRIDQLAARQQAELKLASIIGRQVRFTWLHEAYPVLGAAEQLKVDLQELSRLDLIPIDTVEPDLIYIFKHIVTHEVAYESLTAAVRADLHGQLAAYLEQQHEHAIAQKLDLLAFHYERSDLLEKKRHYLRLAGEAAAARFANAAALEYLRRALLLIPADADQERYTLLLVREKIYHLLGEWDSERQDLLVLEALAERLNSDRQRAEIAERWAVYELNKSNYAAVIQAAERAVRLGIAADATEILIEAYRWWGWAYLYQGQYEDARIPLEVGLQLAKKKQLRIAEGRLIGTLGALEWNLGNYHAARSACTESLAIAQSQGDLVGEGWAIGNLATVTFSLGEYIASYQAFEQSLQSAQALGNRQAEANALTSMGEVACTFGDYQAAELACTQSFQIFHELGAQSGEDWALDNLARIAYCQGQYPAALEYAQQAIAIAQAIGDRYQEAAAQTHLGHILVALGQQQAAQQAYQIALAIHLEMEVAIRATEPQAGLARIALNHGEYQQALAYIQPIIGKLQAGIMDGTEDPFWIGISCVLVLQAVADEQATAILTAAYTTLQQRAKQFTDPAAKQRFLDQIISHREIVQAWELRNSMP